MCISSRYGYIFNLFFKYNIIKLKQCIQIFSRIYRLYENMREDKVKERGDNRGLARSFCSKAFDVV